MPQKLAPMPAQPCCTTRTLPQQHQRNLLPLADGPRPRSHQQAFQKVGLKTSGITLVGNTSNQ
jgi:hypothetical protein